MMTLKSHECRTLFASVAALLLTGCAGFQSASVAPVVTHGKAIRGTVHGGSQPVVGAAITVYAASTAGYGAPNTNILTATVVTDNYGAFDITSDYPCVAGQQLYLLASGGNPGAGTNANSVVMAALGDCTSASYPTFISVNEVTTVGSVFALAPFMSSTHAVGTSSGNLPGLARAFASVNKLVNINTGTSIGSALPPNAVGPSNEINSLANSLASCVNSAGGVAGDNMTNCGTLFSASTPPAGAAPTETVQATLNIAQNPTLNTTTIYNLATPSSPFQPQLAANQPPTDWTMAVKYKNVGLATPTSATVDANGQIWFANSATNTVTVLAQTGAPIAASPLSGNGLSSPAAVAIDASGNAWVANKTGNSLSVFTGTGTVSANYTASGNLSGPTALAFDAPGNLWVANTTGNSLTELNSSGAYVLQVTSGISSPTAVAINPK